MKKLTTLFVPALLLCILFANIQSQTVTQTKESQKNITPKQTLEMLKDGNKRFTSGNMTKRDLLVQVHQTAKGQFPYVVILGCIDSRVPSELIFDQGIGDIFDTRIAGNFADEDVLGSLEFACKITGAKLIVVLGHSNCGAVKGACDNVELGNLTYMLTKIKPAVDVTKTDGTETQKIMSSSNMFQKIMFL